jgi:hypothetical protein
MHNPHDSIELLVTYAMDLLAQTEAQHRAVCRTQTQLNTLRGTDGHRRDIAPSVRDKALAAVKNEVRGLMTVATNQTTVLREMSRTVRVLKAVADD